MATIAQTPQRIRSAPRRSRLWIAHDLGREMTRDEVICVSIRRDDFAARFESKFTRTEGCWIWRGATECGYGCMFFRDDHNKGRRVLAHRISWTLAHGAPPGALFVCHKCDVRLCVNPEHFFLGTSRDNTVDAVNKQLAHCRMTDDRVRLARKLSASGMARRDIASMFGVSTGTIGGILTGGKRGYVLDLPAVSAGGGS